MSCKKDAVINTCCIYTLTGEQRTALEYKLTLARQLQEKEDKLIHSCNPIKNLRNLLQEYKNAESVEKGSENRAIA